ncbi:RNA-binding 4-like isoform X2 [Labeo rohita]|uniref:RNA-binding protein 14 n=1 Tax=Labeo rohita TaxID=84645 RepID=A0A498MIY3_LABRO|nr:RNA-binding protein 14b isoform X1 [Labeo rohita]RXN19033.1 RNA-binding 4-like isoform X2 [Labeo rohita]RXN21298.1 RNA-binding 4-like isoform X2 [Labeo rohita]
MDKGHTVKLFVGNLALDTTQEELSAIFESYGQVVSCSVLRQFAFVHLQGEGAAERAIRELNGREFKGRNLVVEESRGRPLHSTKVFVGNLSSMCTTEDLRELFQTFGKVLECDKVKGYAFVHMENKEDALQAIEALHGTSFKGRPLSVELSKVQPSKQTPTGKIPCVSCGKQGHYAGECPAGKPTLEQYQSQAAVLAAAAAAAAGLPLQVQQSVHNSVYNTSTFDPTYAALTGLTAAGARAEGGTAVAPAVYGALASQVYGTVSNQLYGGTVANQALNSGAAAAAAQVYGSVNPALYGQVTSGAVAAAAAAAAAYGPQVYTSAVANPVFLAAAPSVEVPAAAAAAVNPAYTVAPALYSASPAYGALGAADPAAIFEAARAHYFAQGQQVLAEQQQASSKSGERDRSPLRRSAPLLPDPVMKPFMYQRAKRRALLPTPAGREEAAAQEDDPVARYYAEYYQQYQQLQQYPQYQYAYPSPNPLAAVSALPTLSGVPTQPVATLDSLRPVLPAAPVPAAAAIAMATPRVYEPPPIPPSHKEPLLRRPELALHTPETPFR